jgi:mitochondrial import inner membrane translocase subunit TIM54
MSTTLQLEDGRPPPQDKDLDFDIDKEQYIRANRIAGIEKARKEFYISLPKKLKVARELARGEREPTKE